MKKNLTQLIFGIGLCGTAFAQTSITGPSSSQSPYMEVVVPGATVVSVLTVTDVVGTYTFAGLPDGLGAYDNGDNSFTLLVNHEMGSTSGAVHAHGSIGAYVSKFVINKTTLAVTSGADLIQSVNLWNGTGYTNFSSSNPTTTAAFSRFCSSDMPAKSAFYNAATGKGTQSRIFMNGEESGSGGRAFAHVATGPEAGVSYQLPHLGVSSWENEVASPYEQDKTVVIGMDDATPGQVFVYVGTKRTTGNEIEKAGLFGGKLYGVSVVGMYSEQSASFPAPNTTFNLVDLGNIVNMSGSAFESHNNNMGTTRFLRPEDGAWDPTNPNDFYFVTTNNFTSPTRMWRLRFTDIKNPELGGKITAVLDGTEGGKMYDNIGMNNFGQIMIQEDPGNQAHNGKMFQYDVNTDALTLFGKHDTTRFQTGGANFLTVDEEFSGVIDAQEFLGAGWWLMTDMAHYSIPSPIHEGGQILAFYNPSSKNANPEINLQGNNTNIPSGNTAISAADNTNFGSINLGSAITKTFAIQNAGPGVLYVTGINIGGLNAGDFSLASPIPFPATVAVNGSLVIHIQLQPSVLGPRKAMIYVKNNDFNEGTYTYAIEGNAVAPEINVLGNNVTIVAGQNSPTATDNTDLGLTLVNQPIMKGFAIQNTGTGTLSISGISINGNNSSEFTLQNASSLPTTLNPNATYSFDVQFAPVTVGTRTAIINVANSDSDESSYNFTIKAESASDVSIADLSQEAKFVNLFPNPVKDEATLNITLQNDEHVMITVFNIEGKEVIKAVEKDLEKGTSQISLNTSFLASGEYFVNVTAGNTKNTIKLVVIH